MKSIRDKANDLAKENGFDGASFIANVDGKPVFACYFSPVDGKVLSTGIPVMIITSGDRVSICPAERNQDVFQTATDLKMKKIEKKK